MTRTIRPDDGVDLERLIRGVHETIADHVPQCVADRVDDLLLQFLAAMNRRPTIAAVAELRGKARALRAELANLKRNRNY